MSETVYLITGANRGVGLALVQVLVAQEPTAFIYAGARNPDSATALKEIAEKNPDRVAVVKCISADLESNTALAKQIEQNHGRVDTVIANAALADSPHSAANTSFATMEEHFKVNVGGPLVVFQATYALLKKSAHPRFVTISSQAGSLDGLMVKAAEGGQIAYGSTKAALNWVTRKIHFENEWLVAFPLSPGIVNTEMLQYNATIDTTGQVKQWLQFAATPENAATAMLKIISASTREEHGGQFFNVDGQKADF